MRGIASVDGKIATEAEIMAQGLQTRMAERQDVVEDWISEMAQYAAELCLQEMTLEDVQRIAGKGAVWPQMTKDQVFDLVQIEIRAGSTGKPNRAKEREQWVQMLPQIKDAVTQVAQLRAAGQDDMATTIIKLMEETLRRFDERLDIESFIPPAKAHEPDGQQPPQIPPEVQQALQQIPAMQDALQQLQAANQQLQAQLADKSLDRATKVQIAQELIAVRRSIAEMQDKTKREFLDEWVRAVNQYGGFGKWKWAVSTNPKDLPGLLK
jgi:hypothetical protein